MAKKGEFEVARLYSTLEFRSQLASQFEAAHKLHFQLGAWPFARCDARGQLRKREIGLWLLRAMGMLQHMRRARGTWRDPFRNTPESHFANQLLAATKPT